MARRDALLRLHKSLLARRSDLLKKLAGEWASLKGYDIQAGAAQDLVRLVLYWEPLRASDAGITALTKENIRAHQKAACANLKRVRTMRMGPRRALPDCCGP